MSSTVFFLMNSLGRQYDAKNIGLYRDGELSIFKKCSGPHCVKSLRIRSNSGPHFQASVLNREIRSISPYSVRMRQNAD